MTEILIFCFYHHYNSILGEGERNYNNNNDQTKQTNKQNPTKPQTNKQPKQKDAALQELISEVW